MSPAALLCWTLCLLATSAAQAPGFWNVTFDPPAVLGLRTGSQAQVVLTAGEVPVDGEPQLWLAVARGGRVVSVGPPTALVRSDAGWTSAFNVTGNFLGYATLRAQLSAASGEAAVAESRDLEVTVIRQDRAIDHAFTGSVIVLVSVLYVNFGCAVDWAAFRSTVRRPVGPLIGFVTHFLFMPLISFGLARLLFPDSVALQLGLFFTGVSPAGGASNIWTLVLGGNVALSITMTTISTFAAFGMMPLWIFTLGRVIFRQGNLEVPYVRIASLAVGLLIPLGVGFLVQRYLPRVAKVMARALKPFALLLLVFIVVFAIVTNVYLFELFTWRILVAGMGLPWLGYLSGAILGRVLQQPPADVLAISIETGLENTGISIFLLRVALEQPEADLTTVVPVAVAILTPIPLMLLYALKLCKERFDARHRIQFDAEDAEKMTVRSDVGDSPQILALRGK
ncbi:ileal sodium/bile acid cotransporter-like isoform X2 [Bacillus rossius redtenbacheri]|uniref:ileal sodium/bile acid cotransporter-like isoform X2 n=1 Tax=Bacillus rossius redtenbacheri TaxID=93214 RepID=UPI002FDCEDAC